MTDLAIVIPAFKAKFLDEALKSIAEQTDKSFKVYIGDDNSPEDIGGIIKRFDNKLKISYTRFNTNLGSVALTEQWDRCIGLSENEKWIWLFSDDDLIEADCVKKFHDALTETQSRYDLYRFNTKMIDINGDILYNNTEHPRIEDSYEFAVEKLQLKRGSYVVDHIFSKQRYLTSGKFVSFPLAWASDDATWVNIGTKTGIFTIPDAFVHWRYSFTNISSSPGLANEKLEASIQYIEWLNKWMTLNGPKNHDVEPFEKSKANWLQHQVKISGKTFGALEIYKWSAAFNRRLSISFLQSVVFFTRHNFDTIKFKLKNKLRPYFKRATHNGI